MTRRIVYAKKTCITCKKALAFLDARGVPYTVKDIVTEPPPQEVLEKTLDETNLKAGMNSRSSIYKERNLGQAKLSKAELIRLMQQDPNLIKRPLIIKEGAQQGYQGFDEASLKAFLQT